jgi:hypothetical protein
LKDETIKAEITLASCARCDPSENGIGAGEAATLARVRDIGHGQAVTKVLIERSHRDWWMSRASRSRWVRMFACTQVSL